jgi:hypothetical protein
MAMESTLPEEIVNGASLSGNEYDWQLSLFPHALTKAERLRYACLGGQFQVRLDSGIHKMYWLNVDSDDRRPGEEWERYCKRSCAEVRKEFERLSSETDFAKEAAGWPSLRAAMSRGTDLLEQLVFVAYFVNEGEWLDSQSRQS